MTEDAIQRALEQDARRIVERIPMTDKGKCTAIIKRLRETMAEHGLTQTAVGKMVGFRTGSIISQFLKGKYKGDLPGLTNKLVNLLNSLDQKDRHSQYAGYVETSVALLICTMIQHTEGFSTDEGKIGLVIGDSGHGKSICLRAYAQANPNSRYIELTDGVSAATLLGDIAEAVAGTRARTLAINKEIIAATLKVRNFILMLDEASGLTVAHLNILRQVICVKGRTPLILSGNADLKRTIMQRSVRHGHESLDQFRSRLMQVLDLDELAGRKDGGLYTVPELRKLYERKGVRLVASGARALQTITRTPHSGRLRTCSHIIEVLYTAGDAIDNGRIDSGLIAAAINTLNLPISVFLPMQELTADEPQDQQVAARAG